MNQSRRRFLSMTAGSAGAVAAASMIPPAIARALAIPASGKTGTLQDVEHIVIFMQENRSFDHYFGSLRGVRGYGDRFPISLPSGRDVWFQASQHDENTVVAPFRLDTTSTSAQCVGDLDHSWRKTQGAFDRGRYDKWPKNKTNMTMGYHTREDLPFHYALADAFTVCDNYFCSIPSQTHPNRTYLMTGMIDPTGSGGGPLLDNNDVVDDAKLAPLTWTTFPERLEAAGVSWQIYQQGLDWTDDYNGNYGTNVLANYKQFIDAPKGSSLQKRGMSVRTIDDLAKDVQSNALPSVSWLLPPAAFSEHPKYMPAYGADYTSKILDALTSNPEVWSKTVLLIMYDENDGFFDHVLPPQAPVSKDYGISTVSIDGEVHNYVDEKHRPLYDDDGLPLGLGARVPMTIISPWSKGGFVNSQVFDHTSVIQFVEKRFGVHEPNVTAWRRTVCGDLTSAFDFTKSNASSVQLPDTSGYRAKADEQCKTLAKPTPPAIASQTAPPQEPGTRLARPIPYRHAADIALEASGVVLELANTGAQGAHFYLFGTDATGMPRGYTIESGKSITDPLTVAANADYDLRVYGPNGFHRRFKGVNATAKTPLDVRLRTDEAGHVTLSLRNRTATKLKVTVADNAYGAKPVVIALAPSASAAHPIKLDGSAHWYDLTVKAENYGAFSQRFAGHAENGAASTSDPAA